MKPLEPYNPHQPFRLPVDLKEATTTIPIIDNDGRTIASVRYGPQDFDIAIYLKRVINTHDDLVAACEAAEAYDAAIQKRVIDGAVNLIDTGGGVAMGDDLDALYDDWISKSRSALAKAKSVQS